MTTELDIFFHLLSHLLLGLNQNIGLYNKENTFYSIHILQYKDKEG